MAEIDFDVILTDANGAPIHSAVQGDDERQPTTLKVVAMNALLTPLGGDAETPTLGYRLYTLADKIKGGGRVELEAGQVELIKGRIERTFPPWVVGRSWDALENRDKPVDLPPLDVAAQGVMTHGARQFPPGVRRG